MSELRVADVGLENWASECEVNEAESAGLTVSENFLIGESNPFSVQARTPGRGVIRQRVADEICVRVAALTALDHDVATRIGAAVMPLEHIVFDESPLIGGISPPSLEHNSLTADSRSPEQTAEPGKSLDATIHANSFGANGADELSMFRPAGFGRDMPTPPPVPPQTGPPINRQQTPNPVAVIDANVSPEAHAPTGVGFPKCDSEDVVIAFGEVVGGALAVSAGLGAEPFTAGAATAAVVGGVATVADGIHTLEKCK